MEDWKLYQMKMEEREKLYLRILKTSTDEVEKREIQKKLRKNKQYLNYTYNPDIVPFFQKSIGGANAPPFSFITQAIMPKSKISKGENHGYCYSYGIGF